MSKRKEVSESAHLGGQSSRSTRRRPNLQAGLDSYVLFIGWMKTTANHTSSDAEGSRREAAHPRMDALEVRGIIAQLGVENLGSAFEEYSRKQQKIDLLAIMTYQPMTEPLQLIKHTFLKLRKADWNTLMDCVEGEDVSKPGSALT